MRWRRSNRAYVQYCFDLLHLDERGLQSLPLRKAELAKLMLSPGVPRYSEHLGSCWRCGPG
jgi:ATP-dependent DNA ligase